jgi:hypothetical protein
MTPGTSAAPATPTAPAAPAGGETSLPAAPPGSAERAGGTKAPGIEEPCGPGDRCAPGLTCVSYYGFAGPRGPQFKTCEIRCKDDSVCPKGRTCVTVSDGPGRVCR